MAIKCEKGLIEVGKWQLKFKFKSLKVIIIKFYTKVSYNLNVIAQGITNYKCYSTRITN